MRLPYFPLHLVLFPHLPLPLHIFEERYRAMTRDLLADGSPYAGRFVVSNGGDEDVPEGTVGTIAEIRRAEQFADGRWALVVVGADRVALGSDHPADMCYVQPVDFIDRLDELPARERDLMLGGNAARLLGV